MTPALVPVYGYLVDLKTPKFPFEIKLTFSLHCPKKI
jgi:hypothetical protein